MSLCGCRYLAGTEEGYIHKCSCSYNEQYLETYSGHTVVPLPPSKMIIMFVDDTPVCVSQCYTKQVLSFMVMADGEFCDNHSAVESACNRVLIKASSVTSLKAFCCCCCKS